MKKLIALALASAMGASVSHAFSEDELVVWVGSDKAYHALAELGQQFEEDMGIRVRINTPEDVPSQFQQAASIGQGPDIIFWAHDRTGGWADAGLIRKIKPSADMLAANSEMSWEAVTHKGDIYGYPVSMEAIGMLYNKNILDKAPASFEEILELNETFSDKNIDTLLWDQGNPYFTIPFFTANGGYVFKRENGVYNTSETGINNEGAQKGGQMLTKILETGTSPRGADFAVAEARFARDEAAVMIAGPWSWANFDRVGLNYGVAPLPTINGEPAKAFVGVWSAMLSNASPNAAVAQEFIENYILSMDGLLALNEDAPLGVTANNEFMEKHQKDERVAAVYQSVYNGMLMPNVPEMGRFWDSFTFALQNIITGRESSEESLNSAAKFIVN